ncbi:hypothetical protein MTR62_13110 [Novosphingobium sp. 1949]|uniref:Uncharacterized protein n=1 Tax=Novosphingobium organovorum TaxID=2930092 RepID=A0ABT0BF73_9SPHN|nr:hypothetical protein [Novosphingobium organovorum]MCJ2183623.1 hypothetical protein [Novosphingobium organovorum]
MGTQRLGRDHPFPTAMQGNWRDCEDSSAQLQIDGSEIRYRGEVRAYDFKVVESEGGALTVSLGVNDAAALDGFERSGITGLVLTPDGAFHAYSVKFASAFVRDGA